MGTCEARGLLVPVFTAGDKISNDLRHDQRDVSVSVAGHLQMDQEDQGRQPYLTQPTTF